MSVEDNRELLADFVQMLNSHDPSSADRLVTEDFVNHNPHVGDGREAAVQTWQSFFTAMPDLTAVITQVAVDEQYVAGRLTVTGTQTGDFMTIPATGRRLSLTSFDIWRVEDGLFAEHWDMLDTVDYARQFGPRALAIAGLRTVVHKVGTILRR